MWASAHRFPAATSFAEIDPAPSSLRVHRTEASLDHVVGEQLHRIWDVKSERPGGPGIDHKLIFHRQLHRKLARLCSAKDAIHVRCGLPNQFGLIDSVRNEAAALGVKTE